MYTGITQGLFQVINVEHAAGILSYTVQLNAELSQGLKLGASVAIDGVCQTVIALQDHAATFQAMAETCRLTTLKHLRPGQLVSVERSAVIGQEIGGHEMFGHISGVGKVLLREVTEANLRLVIECPADMMAYIFAKGCIGLNGSSLTIAEVDLAQHNFTVYLIPHTLALTDLGNKQIGDELNIELDAKVKCWVESLQRLRQLSPEVV